MIRCSTSSTKRVHPVNEGSMQRDGMMLCDHEVSTEVGCDYFTALSASDVVPSSYVEVLESVRLWSLEAPYLMQSSESSSVRGRQKSADKDSVY